MDSYGRCNILYGKEVVAKGLDKNSLPSEIEVRKYVFAEDYNKLRLLNNTNRMNLDTKSPVLLYPGCGIDILSPLLYLERLFPHLKQAKFIFNDIDSSLEIIKTILDDVGVCFAEERKNEIKFYWNNMLVELEFVEGNVFEILNQLPYFDIYFERAFRIMKDSADGYENQVFSKLRPGGILISDSGFQHCSLKKLNVPRELSSYGEMIIGIKK